MTHCNGGFFCFQRVTSISKTAHGVLKEGDKEKRNRMKKALIVLASVSLIAVSAFAQKASDLNPKAGHHETNSDNSSNGNGNKVGFAAGSGKLVNHGGGVMTGARVVCIFWGNGSIPSSYSSNAQSFRSSSTGMIAHMGMLTQYGVNESTLVGSQSDVFDSTYPSSTRVTDAMVQSEVAKVAGFYANSNTIYEVFIPSGYYSYDAGSTSCGGPNLAYCAYHSSGDGSHLATNVKYSIEPYPSCSGCSASGFTTNQNANHFMIHETREALTDPYGNAWYDAAGYEADDKCAWTGLFISNGFGFQPEFSNSANNCVQ
jgi:hypothetical protein